MAIPENILYWLLSAISIVGVWLNIRKIKYCFLIWMFTNSCWMVVDFLKGIHAQAFLFLIYLVLSIKGFITWKKEEKRNDKTV